MAKGNIEWELSTIIVVDKCATFIMSSKTILCTQHNVTRVLSWKNMFWNDLRIIEQKISLKNKFWNDLRIVEQKFILQVLGRTKDIFLKESKICHKYEFTRFGYLQN
jgi:hypothetical protein